jgi:hypothetical protein
LNIRQCRRTAPDLRLAMTPTTSIIVRRIVINPMVVSHNAIVIVISNREDSVLSTFCILCRHTFDLI